MALPDYIPLPQCPNRSKIVCIEDPQAVSLVYMSLSNFLLVINNYNFPAQASDFLAAAFSPETRSPQGHQSDHYPPELPSLSSLFFIGQFVRCVVIEDWEPAQGGLNPAIRPAVVLTLVLATVHEHLKPDSLHEGMLIAGCIMGDEDHGYSVALGIDSDGSKVTR